MFEGVRRPIDLMANNSTAVQVTGNTFTSTSGNTAGNGQTAFTPPYSLSTLGASSVKAAVTASNGAGATVGMGAVVLQDVAPGTTVVGTPARQII